MIKQVWKVVQPIDENGVEVLKSCVVWSSALSREYSTEKWTEGAEGTPGVLAFDSQEAASDFKHNNAVWDSDNKSQIWEAESEGEVRVCHWLLKAGLWSCAQKYWADDVRGWWADSGRIGYEEQMKAPEGTLLCERLRLVRKVS